MDHGTADKGFLPRPQPTEVSTQNDGSETLGANAPASPAAPGSATEMQAASVNETEQTSPALELPMSSESTTARQPRWAIPKINRRSCSSPQQEPGAAELRTRSTARRGRHRTATWTTIAACAVIHKFSYFAAHVRAWLGWLCAAAIVLGAAGVAQTPACQKLFQSVGFINKQSGYTVLAFTQPDQLPVAPKSYMKLPISFIISNKMQTEHDYAWSLSQIYGGHKYRKARGSLNLTPGNSAILSPTITLGYYKGTSKIVVSLDNPDESIDFIVARA